MGDSLPTPPAEFSDIDPLPCPNCGYDLRASTAGQCSECGQAIDRANLGISSFPWARRHSILNYLKTAWLLTANSRLLKFEIWKNQNLADARSFGRITTFIVALTLAAACSALLAADPVLFIINRRPGRIGWVDDVFVPWAAGVTFLPVVPAMLLILGIQLTTIHQRLFRLKTASPQMQERASALAHYTAAPLVWLLPLLIFCAFNFFMILSGRAFETGVCLWLCIICIFFAIVLFPLTLVRINQWRLRVRNQSWEHSLLSLPHLIGLWLFALFLDLGFFPWCIGLIWLAIDSFR